LRGEHLAACLWSDGNSIGDRVADQLVHRPGLQAIAGQIAVFRVSLQQPLALQKAPDPFGDGMRQFAQLGAGRGPHRAKPLERSIGPDNIDPIQKQHVEVDVEVQRTAEALDQGHRAGTRPLASEPGLLDQMADDGTIDDAEHLAHDSRTAREQET
jgi:hypothetical protein